MKYLMNLGVSDYEEFHRNTSSRNAVDAISELTINNLPLYDIVCTQNARSVGNFTFETLMAFRV